MIAKIRYPLSETNLNRYLPLWLTRTVAMLALSALLTSCSTSSNRTAPGGATVAPDSAVSRQAEQTDPRDPQPLRTNTAERSASDPIAASDWINTIEDDFSLARQLVEEELQVDLSKIQLQLVDDAPINEEVTIETQRLVAKQFGQSAFADHFLEQIMHPLAGTYAALYSARLQAVMISRSMLENYAKSIKNKYTDSTESTMRAALLTLLIHELVHAADDQRYRIHDNRALNFRASFAQSATFEGHAQWVTRNICKKTGCSIGLQALDNFMFSTDEHSPQLTQPVEAISRSVLEYSYVEGERFIDGLAKRDNGAQLIDELLRNPPLDPIQILAPDTFPDAARERRNQRLIQASRSAKHIWTQSPWIGVETSPLKGVDLRADPTRRQAAVDGFTLLIKAMVSLQFYDQQASGIMPIESTILQTDSDNTARLFANMLHTNTQQSGARVSEEKLNVRRNDSGTSASLPIKVYRTAIDGEISYRTTVAVSGHHVVQVSGSTLNQDLLDDYAVRVLLGLEPV